MGSRYPGVVSRATRKQRSVRDIVDMMSHIGLCSDRYSTLRNKNPYMGINNVPNGHLRIKRPAEDVPSRQGP